ncbi:hypothetical protein [Prevotella sp.]|uniref:hypothetical protein n=1 Tax=Prevotella sp. TaxID=59823 RepID=UPI002F935524
MAEIDGGALSFKSVMDNAQLDTAIEETLRRVQGFSDAVVGSGDTMDSTTKEMVECIEMQKKVIQELEATVSDLNARIDSIEPGDAQNVLIEQANAARQELEAEKQGLVELVGQLDAMQQSNAAAASSFEQIRATLGQLGAACETHEQAIASLEAKYDRLGKEMGKAYSEGRDKEYIALKQQQQALMGEIRVRKNVLKELREQSNALEEEASKIEQANKETQKAASAHATLRQQIKAVKEEMANLQANGIDENSAAYKRLVNELGRLQDIQGDIAAQGKIMSNDENQFAGMLSGLQGVVGGFTAAQGAVALFGAENENLQRIMLKVQALMSITMGLQQVAQTLNKDSAFSLVTLNGLREWWNNLLDVGRGKQEAEIIAIKANTAAEIENAVAVEANAGVKATQEAVTSAGAKAQVASTASTKANTASQIGNTIATGGQAAAAKAGTVANIGLAGAFRMVGAAIKSIPVIGWVLAGISALVGILSHFIGKANESKEAAKEFGNNVIEACYKPIGTVEMLSAQWKSLGDNLEAKKKFIDNNKKAFDELGVSVSGVTDAENLLVANKDAFIEAQIAKAKATVLINQAMDLMKKKMETQNRIDTGDYWDTFAYSWKRGLHNELYDLQDDIRSYDAQMQNLFTQAYNTQVQGWTLLQKTGVQATQTYAEGTLGAIEQAIRLKQEALKNLTNNDDYKKGLKEIEALQKQANKITGTTRKKSGGGSAKSGAKKDQFLEKLSKRKTEYARFMKWINSGDAILVKSANKEFAGLLKEGATYIDYLKNQREIILQVGVANRTKAQNKQLRQLNDAIAEETKKTVLEAFNAELSEQLTNAQTVLEMLSIIEKKRKELSNDGTELDNAKSQALDDAQRQAEEQAKSETETLLENYASYAERKRRIEEQFNADIALLQRKRAQATSDSERAEIDATIRNRQRQYETDSQTSGNADYDAMLADYGTFEQRKQAIIDEYEKKRRTAQEMGNTEMVEQIDKAQAQALSKFALDELQAHPDWALMFGDLDEITTAKLEELIAKINNLDGAFLGVEFDPKDLETLKKKIQEMKDEIQERNPFKALISGIKDYSKAADSESKKKALKNMFESASGSIDLAKGSLDAVVSGMDKMGVAMDDNTQAILGDIGGILDGASQIAQGIATGNPLSVIQGSIGFLSSAFDLFNSRDRKAEKQIKKHQSALKDLENAYNQLSWAIDKALGAKVYDGQMQAIHNMEQQREHLKGIWEAEQSKKKTDKDKVRDWQEQYAELGRQIQDMYESIAKDILQTDAKDFAGTLGDALVEAFKKGEDASKAFEQTVNEVLQNAIVNQLKKRFLEQQLQGALDNLMGSMGYWNGDDFIFDGLTDTEIEQFKAKVQAASNNFNQALSIYKDLFKDITEDNTDESLTGAVKGVTEETASIVAGQINAVRINQLEATAILRQQLQALNTIAANTAFNRYLVKLDRIVALLEKSDNSLRSQGLS